MEIGCNGNNIGKVLTPQALKHSYDEVKEEYKWMRWSETKRITIAELGGVSATEGKAPSAARSPGASEPVHLVHMKVDWGIGTDPSPLYVYVIGVSMSGCAERQSERDRERQRETERDRERQRDRESYPHPNPALSPNHRTPVLARNHRT